MREAKSPADLLREAADVMTPTERLRDLASRRGKVRAAVLRNPACPNDVLRDSLASGEPEGWGNPGLELFLLTCEIPQETILAWAHKHTLVLPEAPHSPCARRLFRQIQDERAASMHKWFGETLEKSKTQPSAFQLCAQHTATYGWSVATLEVPVKFAPHYMALSTYGAPQNPYACLQGLVVTQVQLAGCPLLHQGKQGQHASSFLPEATARIPLEVAPGLPGSGRPGDRITVQFCQNIQTTEALAVVILGERLP